MMARPWDMRVLLCYLNIICMLLADGLAVTESAEFATNFEWVQAVFLNGSEALISRFRIAKQRYTQNVTHTRYCTNTKPYGAVPSWRGSADAMCRTQIVLVLDPMSRCLTHLVMRLRTEGPLFRGVCGNLVSSFSCQFVRSRSLLTFVHTFGLYSTSRSPAVKCFWNHHDRVALVFRVVLFRL